MKYRVKFRCYWYNTGAGDNHHYINHEDFDTIEEAKAFADRVTEQGLRSIDNSPGWIEREDEWENSGNKIEIENGFICGRPEIVKYHLPREEKL